MKMSLNKIVRSNVLFRSLLVVCCLSLVTACGFHLRGAVVLPEQMLKTYVEGASEAEPLHQEIRIALESAGGELVEREAASAVLNISSARFDRRVLSVDASGLASEYELNFLLRFSLQGARQDSSPQDSLSQVKEQVLLVPMQKLSISRSYSFDSSNVLAKSEEETLLREEMLRRAVRQMLQQLQVSLMSSSATNASPGSSSPMNALPDSSSQKETP